MKNIVILLVSTMIALPGSADAQEAAKTGDRGDPFRKARGVQVVPPAGGAAKSKQTGPQQVGILLEYFELDHADANRLVTENAGKLNAVELRKVLQTMVEKDTAKLVETVYARTKSGQRTKVESVKEDIYATEFDPPEIPQTIGDGVDNAPTTAANPTAFEMRPVGVTFEVDPVVGADNETIELNVAPEFTSNAGDKRLVPEGTEHPEMETITFPIYYTIKFTTAIVVSDGEYALLSVHTPNEPEDKRILLLLRADILR